MFKKTSYLIAVISLMGAAGSISAKGTCWRFKNREERDYAERTGDFSKSKACSQQDSGAACQKEIDFPRREAHKQLGSVGIWGATCAECNTRRCESTLMEKVN